MATTTDCTTTARYCRECDAPLAASSTPAGEPVLECASCGHCVMLSTVAASTLAAPRRQRRILRRRVADEALAVASQLNDAQAGDGWSQRRQGQIEALLVVIDALRESDEAALRQLAA